MTVLLLIALGLMGTWWLIDGLLLVLWAVWEILRQLIMGDPTRE